MSSPIIAAVPEPLQMSPTFTGPSGSAAILLNIPLLKSMPGVPMSLRPGASIERIFPVGSMTWVNGCFIFADWASGNGTSWPPRIMCIVSIWVTMVAAPSAGRTDLTVWIMVIFVVMSIGMPAPV